MKSTLTVFVALVAALAAAPANAAGARAAGAKAAYNSELTVTEVKALKLDAHQLQQARVSATRDGVVTRVERKQIQNLQEELNKSSLIYTHNRRDR